MLKKILQRDYLKGYREMTAEERGAYLGRVGEWLQRDGGRLLTMTDRPMAKSQNLVTLTTRWSAEDCRALAYGIMLLTAMVGMAETWLPTQLYMKSAYRAVRQMAGILAQVAQGTGLTADGLGNAPELPAVGQGSGTKAGAKAGENGKRQGGDAIATKQTKIQTPPLAPPLDGMGAAGAQGKRGSGSKAGVAKEVSAAGINKATQTVAAKVTTPLPLGEGSGERLPARPRHIDQYVHLLPAKTQERAAQYGPLMRDLGAARENLRLLMDDEHASAKSREQWAKVITKIDGQIKAIRDELDREWEKIAKQGVVKVDALGNAYVVEQALPQPSPEGAGVDGNAAKAAAADADADKQAQEKKKRFDQLKKFLRERRIPEKNREAYAQKFREYHDELVRDYGAEYFTDTMKENAKTLGIEFN